MQAPETRAITPLQNIDVFGHRPTRIATDQKSKIRLIRENPWLLKIF
jgi:hypothetical protein